MLHTLFAIRYSLVPPLAAAPSLSADTPSSASIGTQKQCKIARAWLKIMAHSPSKRARLHLRSRVRDDALLNRLLSEVRAHEKKVPQTMLAISHILDNRILIAH